MEHIKFKLNIQLFADAGEDQGSTEEPIQDNETPKGFTQQDIDTAVQDAVDKARAEWETQQQQQQTEAQKLAKMNADEKKAYQEKKRLEELEKREAEVTRRELMSTARETLVNKKLPVELASVLDYSSADACNQSIETIGKAFQDAVQSAVASRIAGTNTMRKSNVGNTTSLTKEGISKMSAKEINENWEEIQELMKNGQLN